MKKLDKLYKEVVNNDNAWSELDSLKTQAKNFLRKYGIGFKVKTFKEEPGAIKKLRTMLQDFVLKDDKPSVAELQQDIKDEIIKYDEGKPNFTDYEVERIARTETSALKNVMKLMEWKEMGVTKVKHVSRITKNSGKKDIAYNGKVFDIDYLLKNAGDRIPLHPMCVCNYSIYE
jgi:arsenate reductase-like glutaredoxin family protein